MKKTVNKIVVAVILIGLLCIQASAKGYAVEESFTLEPGEVIYIEESEFSELDILIEYSPSSVELMYGVADEPDPHRGDHQSYIATHGRASNYIRPDQDHYYIFVGNLSLTDDVDVDLSYSTFIELRRAPREERNIVRKRIPLISVSDGDKIKHITLGDLNMMSVHGSSIMSRILSVDSVLYEALEILKVNENTDFFLLTPAA